MYSFILISFVSQSFVNHYNRPRDVCLSFCGYVVCVFVCVFVCLFVYSESYLVPETDEGLFPDVPPEDEEAEDVLESQTPKNVAPSNSARMSGKDRTKRNLLVKYVKFIFKFYFKTLAVLASYLFMILKHCQCYTFNDTGNINNEIKFKQN